MSTLPVKWVNEECLFTTKGLREDCIPVVRLSDLDALREGLAGLIKLATPPDRIPATEKLDMVYDEAQRLLAMLPPREPSVPYPEWCRHKEQCAGRNSCPDDPTCAD